MEKLLGRGDPKKGGILQEGEDTVSLGIFSSWGMANVTTVTFNDILVIVFLFPLNVGVSLCFQCTVWACMFLKKGGISRRGTDTPSCTKGLPSNRIWKGWYRG